MDLKQSKLTKTEWNNVEVPVSSDEKRVLDLIQSGYADVNHRSNVNLSLFQIVKIDVTPENEAHLYTQYFEKEIQSVIAKYGKGLSIQSASAITSGPAKPKKVDMIRLQNLDTNIVAKRDQIFEYVMIDMARSILKSITNKSTKYAQAFYTLIQLKKSSIPNVNTYVLKYIDSVIAAANAITSIESVIHRAYDFIEKNPLLLKYEDATLFPHQKQLFTIFKDPAPKLVLYIAPTGTGKTLSPIGLSEGYRVIFICVSRHVGLALAKSAISNGKRIAFAFGCETASDIRLHYFASATYIKNRRTGGIGKVDNSVGTKVEIMICDVQSYLTAMHYMLAFNPEQNIVTYWDEPTITMDYEDHELHAKIHENWKENKISKMVLSCATLPRENEIQETIADFRCKFDGATSVTISSYDFKKTIAILDKNGKCALPHLLFSGDYDKLMECVRHCETNKTMLRYFDLSEIIRYIKYVNKHDVLEEAYKIDAYFASISDITMNSLKLYYLETLKHLNRETWPTAYAHLSETQEPKFAGIQLTTADAHTLTDGPTIFLANDVEKIGKFYIQNSHIPPATFKTIMDKIDRNNDIQEQLLKNQQTLDDKLGVSKDTGEVMEKKDKKNDRREQLDPEIHKIVVQIEKLRAQIQSMNLDQKYIPNTTEHQKIWSPGNYISNAFIPIIEESTVKEIMELDVDNSMKILLLLGIGMFCTQSNVQYMEIMKRLAYEQKLYIIIASSDYIYGTNYSFCHGFIGKDLTHMTQQKIIQSMGRIGRNKVQQEYTVRFRDDEIMMRLFKTVEHNLEAINMSKLFTS
jgi:hypothetical protein